jgi:hypothetical protein
MSGQKQHVDLHRKLAIRRELLNSALPGAAYVPFIGDGDIAAEMYPDRRVFGADLDPARVETARSRLADSDIRVADCDGYPFADVSEPFAVADFDSYANPYRGLSCFWSVANKAERIIVFGTDGLRQAIKRNRCRKSLPSGDETSASTAGHREQYNFWWERFVRPYLDGLFAPWTISAATKYLRKDMLYWGVVVDSPECSLASVVMAEPMTHRGKFGDRKRVEYLELIRQGHRRGAAARAVGVDPETARNAYNKDPEFADAVELAEIEACDIVEDALLEAAKSGNVTACQVWLYNRSPDRWKDQRNFKTELSGPEGKALSLKVEDARELTDAELLAIASRGSAGAAEQAAGAG